MPWCPKCKNEYRDGIKVCADCGCELIENENIGLLPILFGTLEEMELLKDFLIYSHIDSASVREADEEGFYELLVEACEEKHAKKLAIMFIQQKTKEQAEMQKADADGDEESSPVGVYEDSAQKAEDNKSSGITLLFVGFLGIIVLVLAVMGIIPLRLSPTTSYMVYGVMGALFILFIVMGVVSMRNSKIFAKKAESENSLRSTIEDWCLKNLSAQELDKEAFGDGAAAVSEEAKYFGRAAILKKKISTQFMNLDNQFLDHFVDDIYEDIFEEE